MEASRSDHIWVGQRVRYFRQRRGWSVRALARRAGLPHPQVLDIEAGTRPLVAWKTIAALICALEIPYSDFFGVGPGPGVLPLPREREDVSPCARCQPRHPVTHPPPRSCGLHACPVRTQELLATSQQLLAKSAALRAWETLQPSS